MMRSAFDAWYLPGVEPDGMATLELGPLTCRYPVPTTELIAGSIRVLREAGRALRERPVAELARVIAAAAARLADTDDPLRAEAVRLVGAATGYSDAMTRLVLDRMTDDWTTDALQRLLTAERGDPGVLDGFRPAAPGRLTRAYGPDLAFQVFAGNVPGVAVTSLVRALLVKAPSLGKLASGQPVLPVLFARALESVDPEAARALAITYWPGGSEDAEWRAVEAADTVVVYGGEEAVAAYRQRARGRRLVVHGPRFSVGLVAADALDEDLPTLARDVARAVAIFDQHGCVSPHAIWVEETPAVTAADFAEALAAALAETESELPRGRVSPGEASTIQQERAAAELKGHAPSASGTRVLAGGGTRWTVVHDPEPALRASCLNRFVRVHPIPDLAEAVDLLAHAGGQLQSVALAGGQDRRDRLAHHLAGVGATRVTTFRRLPWPPPDWHHDGHEPIRELIRWVDLEP